MLFVVKTTWNKNQFFLFYSILFYSITQATETYAPEVLINIMLSKF